MAGNKYLALNSSNRPAEVEAVQTSAGAGDAGKIPALDATGRFDDSMMPVGIGADTAQITASEALAAGDFVNIYDNAGTANIRKADASAAAAGKMAHGFVLEAVSSSASGTVYFEGTNTQLTGLTAGTVYVLSHSAPGGVVAQASGTTTAGHSLQVLGIAISATEINFERNEPIIRA